MEDIIVPLIALPTIFIGMPWIVLHYLLSWKKNASLTAEDEKLMDQLYETARRLDERLQTIERIIAADHPEYRQPVAGTYPTARTPDR